jgi:hypothetical protein
MLGSSIWQQSRCHIMSKLTGVSRIEPPQLIRRMNKLPICFIISFRGICGDIVWSGGMPCANQIHPILTPIFPLSLRLLGRSLVWSIVAVINSSNREILTLCDKA